MHNKEPILAYFPEPLVLEPAQRAVNRTIAIILVSMGFLELFGRSLQGYCRGTAYFREA